MNTQQSDDLNRVLEKICEVAEKSAGGDYVYRGEPACYPKVSSTLYREYEKEIEAENFEIDVVQKEILDEARKYIRETADDLEILTELQHHGGKTNLIDFTTDYLIALFFSCDGEHDKAGRVILLEKESDDYKVEKPPKTINRVESQKSIFVQASEGFVEPDEVVTVPKGLKQAMLDYLRKHHDISTETIYNDLHGFIENRRIHQSGYTEFYSGLTCQKRGNSAKTRDETQKWYEKAIKRYTKAVKLKPDMPEAYNNRGVTYHEQKQYDLAIQDFNQATKLAPEFDMAYNNRGNVYRDQGHVDLAIQDHNTTLKLNSDNASAYNNRGLDYDAIGEFDLAIQDYNMAIELDPNDAGTYYNRGNAYSCRGTNEPGRALQDYSTAIKLNPEFVSAYNNRGLTYFLLKEFGRAIEDFDSVIELDLESVSAYEFRGLAHLFVEEFKLAILDYSVVLGLRTDNASAYCFRGFAWLHLGEWNKAKVDLTAARDKGVDIVTSFHNQYQSVAGFVKEYGVQLPEDIAELLTRQKSTVGTPLSQNRYALPILTALEQKGGDARTQDALRTVCQLMENQLEDIDKSRRMGGQEYWKNRAHAMRSELVRKGFLKDDSPRGIWEITDAGREYLRNNRGG